MLINQPCRSGSTAQRLIFCNVPAMPALSKVSSFMFKPFAVSLTLLASRPPAAPARHD